MQFEARKMLPEDAHTVTKTMWEPGAAELERIGADPASMAEKFIKIADYGYSLFANGALVAVMGAQEKDGTYYTWFMATPGLESIGRDFVIWLRKFCKDQVEAHGGDTRLEMYSASLHPNSDRWFTALRFERGDKDVGIFRHYRYAAKKKLTTSA